MLHSITQVDELFKTKGFYKYTEKDTENFSLTHANSYQDYPLYNHFFGGKYNFELAKRNSDAMLNSAKRNSIIYADSEDINGYVILIPPKQTGIKAIPYLLGGGYKFSPSIIYRLNCYESYVNKIKKKYTDYNCWYVNNLSVKKDMQRKGIGTKLLEPIIQYCLDNNTKLYLETNTQKNVNFYKKLGFTLVDESTIPNSNVKNYAMLIN